MSKYAKIRRELLKVGDVIIYGDGRPGTIVSLETAGDDLKVVYSRTDGTRGTFYYGPKAQILIREEERESK